LNTPGYDKAESHQHPSHELISVCHNFSPHLYFTSSSIHNTFNLY
jgi:hypothetical protein